MTKRQFWWWSLITILLAIMLIVNGYAPLAKAAGKWTTGKPMPTARKWAMSGVIGTKLYVAGGDTPENSLTSKLEIYDSTTDTWSTGADMPFALDLGVTGVMNGKLYMTNLRNSDPNNYGFTGLLLIYDPITNSWSQGATQPITPYWAAIAGVINNKLYLISGYSDQIQIYDPTTNTWTLKVGTLANTQISAGGVINSKLYATGDTSKHPNYPNFMIYDPSTGTMTVNDHGLSYFETTAGVINGILYVAGGTAYTPIGGNSLYNGLQSYDPVTDAWTPLESPPSQRVSTVSGVINGKLYVIGGLLVTADRVVNTLEIYEPNSGNPTPTATPTNTLPPTSTSTPVSPTSTPFPQPVNSDFRPNPDGYNFPNVAAGSSTVGAVDLLKMFGDSVCAYKIGEICIAVKHSALIWANKASINTFLKGHCNGMSVTSLRFYTKSEQPSSYQPFANKTYDLNYWNPAVSSNITNYQIALAIPEVRRRLHSYFDDTISQSLANIRQGFSNNNPFMLFISNSISAHALVPYSIEQIAVDTFHIKVYDPNRPNDATRKVIAHPKANTWEYEYANNEIWNNIMYAYPVSAFQTPLTWEEPKGNTLLAPDESNKAAKTPAQTYVLASPGTDLHNETGNLLSRMALPDGTGNPSPLIYEIPSQSQQNVTVNRLDTTSGLGTLVYLGNGTVSAIDGLPPHTQGDSIIFNDTQSSMIYKSTSTKLLTFTLSTEGEQRTIAATVGNIQLGVSSVITLNLSLQNFSIETNENVTSNFSIDLQQDTGNAVAQEFQNSAVALGSNESKTIEILPHLGTSLTVTTTNSQGTNVQNLSNQTQQFVYLPWISK